MSDSEDPIVDISLPLSKAQVAKWAIKVAEDAVTVNAAEDPRIDQHQSTGVLMMLSHVRNILDESIRQATGQAGHY